MNPRIGCVILAAGQSRRFGGGEPKLLLPFGGKPLVQHVIDAAAASASANCTLVVGAYAEKILELVDSRRCAIIENSDWQEGIASSIRTGLGLHLDDEACIFVVGDQPFVTTADFDGLIEAHQSQEDAIAALKSADVWGSPILFPRTDFEELRKLRGDSGAKRCAEGHQDRVIYVNAWDRNVFTDVDTVRDYERITAS